jgi:hypothetical protein
MSEFYCCNCRQATTLTVHGYCAKCGSDAIAPGFSLRPSQPVDWISAAIEDAARMKKAQAHEDFRKLYDEGEIR